MIPADSAAAIARPVAARCSSRSRRSSSASARSPRPPPRSSRAPVGSRPALAGLSGDVPAASTRSSSCVAVADPTTASALSRSVAGAPSAATRATVAAASDRGAGSGPSTCSCSAVSSARRVRTYSGWPPVWRRSASAARADSGTPRPAASSPTSLVLSGPSSRRVTDAFDVANLDHSSSAAVGRDVTTASTRSPGCRRAKATASASRDEASAQCRSSITTAIGCASARWATSCRPAPNGSAVGDSTSCPSIHIGSASAPSTASARNWANRSSEGRQAASSAVLPAPAWPWTTTICGRPFAAWPARRSMVARSASRPTNEPGRTKSSVVRSAVQPATRRRGCAWAWSDHAPGAHIGPGDVP